MICGVINDTGIATPEQLDLLLRVASTAYLTARPDQAQLAAEFLDIAAEVLDEEGITHALFAQFIANQLPSALQIVADGIFIRLLGEQAVIGEFDRYLLKTHLRRQKQVVEGAG